MISSEIVFCSYGVGVLFLLQIEKAIIQLVPIVRVMMDLRSTDSIVHYHRIREWINRIDSVVVLLIISIVATKSSYYEEKLLLNKRRLFLLYREYKQSMGGDQFYLKRGRYSSTSRSLAVILPIICFIVIAGAAAVIFVYYKKLHSSRSKDGKSIGTIGKNENYSGKYNKSRKNSYS